MLKKYSVEIKWGFIFSIIALIWMIIEKSLGWHDEKIESHATYTLFFFPIAILMYVWALREKKASLGGKMSWKEGFISGILIGFVVALLAPITQYITHTIISPNYFANVTAYALENQPDVSEDQLKAYFNLGNYVKMAMLQAPIAGALTGAIVSAFLKNKSNQSND